MLINNNPLSGFNFGAAVQQIQASDQNQSSLIAMQTSTDALKTQASRQSLQGAASSMIWHTQQETSLNQARAVDKISARVNALMGL